MKLLFLCLLVFSFSFVKAQENTDKPKNTKLRFRSINTMGVLAGENPPEPLLQTVNGLNYKTWFAGIGTGIDYYVERSIPVFLDVRKAISNNVKAPFIYVAAGKHFAWHTEKPASWISSGMQGKWYYDAGAGYQVPLSSKMQMILSAGYSCKKMTEEVNTMPWVSAWPPPHGAIQEREHIFRRLAFKMGLQF